MTILITGGAGFIGSNFVYYMLEKYPQYKIVCVDKLTRTGNIETLEKALENDNFIFYKADICNKEEIEEIFEKESPCVVVNFAAENNVDISIEDPGIFLKTNILGTQVLMDASIKYGVKRYHQVSTDEVYGDLPLDRPDLFFTETTHIHTSSPYSASKASADLLVMAYHRTFGLADNLTYSSPIAMSMIALLALNRMIYSNKTKYLLASIFIVAMAFVSARTSLVVFLCGTVGLLIMNIKKTGRVTKIIIAILVGVFIAYNALEFYLEKGGYDQHLFWLLDGLKNIGSVFNENVESHYDSTSYFFDARRLIIPSDIRELFLGTGTTVMIRNSRGVASDIGFINDIWYGGIFYAVSMYVLFISMCHRIKKSFSKVDGSFANSIVVIFLAVMIVSNIKGIAFWFNDFTSLMIIVYMYIINEEERLKSGGQYFSNGYMQNIQP